MRKSVGLQVGARSGRGLPLRVVVTGGPCSGRSTVLDALEADLEVVRVPYGARVLREGGFPEVGRMAPAMQPGWERRLQVAVAEVQEVLEDLALAEARTRGVGIVLCEGGLLDGAANLAGGLEEWSAVTGRVLGEIVARYDLVLHLESMATGAPERFGRAGDPLRLEELARAAALEAAMRRAWALHPEKVFLDWKQRAEWKVVEAYGTVEWARGRRRAA